MCDSFPDALTYDGTFDCADGSWMLKEATCCENQHLAPHLAPRNDFPSPSRVLYSTLLFGVLRSTERPLQETLRYKGALCGPDGR